MGTVSVTTPALPPAVAALARALFRGRGATVFWPPSSDDPDGDHDMQHEFLEHIIGTRLIDGTAAEAQSDVDAPRTLDANRRDAVLLCKHFDVGNGALPPDDYVPSPETLAALEAFKATCRGSAYHKLCM